MHGSMCTSNFCCFFSVKRVFLPGVGLVIEAVVVSGSIAKRKISGYAVVDRVKTDLTTVTSHFAVSCKFIPKSK